MPAHIKKFTLKEIVEYLNGAVVVGVTGTGTGVALGTAFSDAVGAPFADVQAGDVLEISGAGCYVIASVADDNNLVLASPLDKSYTADARYKITRGGGSLQDFDYFSVYGQSGSGFIGITSSSTF